jgi:actin-related protein 10
MLGSILVTGGTSMLSGFQDRLLADVRSLLAAPKHPLSALQRRAALINDRAPAFVASMLPWLGGSLAGALKTNGGELVREKWDASADAEGDDEAEGPEQAPARRRRRQFCSLPDWTKPPL